MSPNPVSSMLKLRLTSNTAQKVCVDVYDAAGRTVESFILNIPEGTTDKQVNMLKHAKGLYTVGIKG